MMNSTYAPLSPSSVIGRPLKDFPVTKWLIYINVAIFVLGFFLPERIVRIDMMFYRMSLPESWGFYSFYTVFDLHQVWRLITYQFIHANLGHIVFNMWALYFFGRFIETALGASRYLLYYLLCGIGGAIFSSIIASFGFFGQGELLELQRYVPMVGASGAIYGILTATAFLAPHTTVQLLFPPITLKMRTLAIGLLLLSTLFILFNWENAGGEAGHMGGMIIGFLLILLPLFRPRGLTMSHDPEYVWILYQKAQLHGMNSLTNKERRILFESQDELLKK